MTKTIQKALIISAVVYIVIGLLLVIWPDQARQIIIYAIGAAALLYGGYRIVDFFSRKENLSGVQIGVALGIACIMLGLFLLFKANVVVALLAAVIGVAVIVDSVLRLQIALNLRLSGERGWIALIVTAFITLVFGILLLFNPFTAVRVATVIGGASLLADGVFTLWGALQSGGGGTGRTVTIR
ncbi:MAG: DUF308 domain-containing protein [Eubacteriales bacterium]|nr:DUF308 domain-containing protein [Eubacteriales bacterium]